MSSSSRITTYTPNIRNGLFGYIIVEATITYYINLYNLHNNVHTRVRLALNPDTRAPAVPRARIAVRLCSAR